MIGGIIGGSVGAGSVAGGFDGGGFVGGAGVVSGSVSGDRGRFVAVGGMPVGDGDVVGVCEGVFVAVPVGVRRGGVNEIVAVGEYIAVQNFVGEALRMAAGVELLVGVAEP